MLGLTVPRELSLFLLEILIVSSKILANVKNNNVSLLLFFPTAQSKVNTRLRAQNMLIFVFIYLPKIKLFKT